MTNRVDERVTKALLAIGAKHGRVTYDDINLHLPDEIQDTEAIDQVLAILDDAGIAVVDGQPVGGLANADLSTPEAPFCVTEIELHIGKHTHSAELHWAPCLTRERGVPTALVVAPAGVTVTTEQAASAAEQLGYKVTKATKKLGHAIDVRGALACCPLEISVNPYLVERGAIAEVAPHRMTLKRYKRTSTIVDEVVVITNDLFELPFSTRLPLVTDGNASRLIDVDLALRTELRSWGFKWIDVVLVRSSEPIDARVTFVTIRAEPSGYRLPIELVAIGTSEQTVIDRLEAQGDTFRQDKDGSPIGELRRRPRRET